MHIHSEMITIVKLISSVLSDFLGQERKLVLDKEEQSLLFSLELEGDLGVSRFGEYGSVT